MINFGTSKNPIRRPNLDCSLHSIAFSLFLSSMVDLIQISSFSARYFPRDPVFLLSLRVHWCVDRMLSMDLLLSSLTSTTQSPPRPWPSHSSSSLPSTSLASSAASSVCTTLLHAIIPFLHWSTPRLVMVVDTLMMALARRHANCDSCSPIIASILPSATRCQRCLLRHDYPAC